MASTIALAAHQSCTFALCAHEIIETNTETLENVHGNQGCFFILAENYFLKNPQEFWPVEQ